MGKTLVDAIARALGNAEASIRIADPKWARALAVSVCEQLGASEYAELRSIADEKPAV